MVSLLHVAARAEARAAHDDAATDCLLGYVGGDASATVVGHYILQSDW
jgi:hypothetical protein